MRPSVCGQHLCLCFEGMTRDLDAMGLMTQVKKGDDVR